MQPARKLEVDEPLNPTELSPQSDVAESQASDSEVRYPKYKTEDFRPETASVPEIFLPNPEFIRALDQKDEGSAVGHGIAGMVNYLLRERGINDQVSVRMLQQLSKKYDNAPLDVDQGSSLGSGMQAWLENGVCSESLWPYRPREWGELTDDRRRAALKYKPTNYLRVPGKTQTLRAAIAQNHAVVVGATVHNGWMGDSASKRGIIPYTGKDSTIGGHAFAVLGYNHEGFILQNSWGSKWGGYEFQGRKFPGCALWSYPDFETSSAEGFVATLPEFPESRPRLRRAGYQSDTAEGRDLLDIQSDVAAVCAVLAARDVKPPLALGLFGNWGTGKSFFMAQMYEEIKALTSFERKNPGQTPYSGDIVQIRFNAWHYLDANLWASLVDEIFTSLLDAVSGGAESGDAAQKRIIAQLGEVRGLYRQSQIELVSAQHESEHAEAQLVAKQGEVKQQENTLHSLRDQLTRLVEDQPEVQQKLAELKNALGEPQLATSYQALKEQADHLHGLDGSLQLLQREMLKPEGRTNRLILLATFPLLCAAIAYFANRFLQTSSGLLAEIRGWINLTSGLVFGFVAWLAPQVARVARLVVGLQRVTRKIDAARVERMEELTAPERRELELRQQAEQAARVRADEARDRVERLEKELRELDPARQLQTFIKDRGASEDYRKQLGLVSLVRRDFERLSELLGRSQAVEDAWYTRRQNAEAAKTPFAEPKPCELPVRRIILYIDDLDRCQPDRVIEVLEAVHLLLAFPLFVVVVAVDPRWLRECLEMHYPKLLAMNGIEGAHLTTPSTPQDYLEKIFQIPYYLRPISLVGYRKLIDGLMTPDLEAATLAATSEPSTKAKKAIPATAPGQDSSGGTLAVRGPEEDDQSENSGGEESSDVSRMNPERLKFKQWEVNDMKRFGSLFRTPRAVKRFINTYRLIRVAIPESDMPEFLGSESNPGRYRVAQLLLAVVSGYPNVAPHFLQLLLQQSQASDQEQCTWSGFLNKCAAMSFHKEVDSLDEVDKGAAERSPKSRAKPGHNPTRARKPKDDDQTKHSAEEFGREWSELCETLANLENESLPERLETYYDLVRRSARFSFSVSALPE